MRRGHYRNAERTLDGLLELGMVPVINENDTVATDEIRFGDNDRLAALVAHVTRASALILLSDVDGLYDGDPRRGGARRIEVVASPEDLADVKAGKTGQGGVGSGGMSTKVESALIATAAGIPTVVTAASEAAAALAGEPTGTNFAATGQRPRTRLLWLAHRCRCARQPAPGQGRGRSGSRAVAPPSSQPGSSASTGSSTPATW